MNTSRPAIDTYVERPNVIGFGSTCRVTVPLPDPASSDTTVTQDVLFDTVQVQSEGVVTVTMAVPPVFGTMRLVGLTV
jgi:hypothetical protein